MDRHFYNMNPSFLYSEIELARKGDEYLQAQTSHPFHYLFNEQARSLAALQELQHEVGALLKFKEIVIDAFPNLRNKLTSSSHDIINKSQQYFSNIPISTQTCDWVPGIRVRKKKGLKEESRASKKNDLVQDSGFSTETSSKETHSALSTVLPTHLSSGLSDSEIDDEDELSYLLDTIHRKGIRLKEEIDIVKASICHQTVNSLGIDDFHQSLFNASACDISQIRRERDFLFDRLSDLEIEVEETKTNKFTSEKSLGDILIAKQNLEKQLQAMMTQRGAINSRIHDLHFEFVTENDIASFSDANNVHVNDLSKGIAFLKYGLNSKKMCNSEICDILPKIRSPNLKVISTILRECNPFILQKYLLISAVQNQVLQQQVDCAGKLELNLIEQIEKITKEKEDLYLQLEDRNIELAKVLSRVRHLERYQKHDTNGSSSDISRLNTSPLLHNSRSESTKDTLNTNQEEILNLQVDHSSSTESAHDQFHVPKKLIDIKHRKPSKIPLKNYSGAKPHCNKQGLHTASRPSSAQSMRNNKSEANSLSISKANSLLMKSKNASSITSKDSLSNKLRCSDSLTKLSQSNGNSFVVNRGKWDLSMRESSEKTRSKSTSSFWNFFKLRDNSQT